MGHACQGEQHNILPKLPRSLILINIQFEISQRLAIKVQPIRNRPRAIRHPLTPFRRPLDIPVDETTGIGPGPGNTRLDRMNKGSTSRAHMMRSRLFGWNPSKLLRNAVRRPPCSACWMRRAIIDSPTGRSHSWETGAMVLPETRKRYAEEIRIAARINSEPLLNAFATVPREDFVGQGPWSVLSRPAPGQRQPLVTGVSDPCELYRDVAVYLDASKNLTNGNPSTLAPWLDALNLSEGRSVFHLGCGTGYYTAIIAEVVGPRGQVTAAEVDPVLAAQARKGLAKYPNVQVMEGDGVNVDTGRRDAIFVNAGVTHPTERWLESIAIGGTLVLPLTVEIGMPNVGKGQVLRVSRSEFGYEARFFPVPVMIYSCTSARDAQIGAALGQRLMSGTFDSVRSLRRDPHSPESSCWLHTTTFCLSTESLRG